MPSGSALLLKSFPEKINDEIVTWLELKAQKKLDSIQNTIINQEINWEEDTRSDEPTPLYVKPFIPLLFLLRPLLNYMSKHVETSFDFYADSKFTSCGACQSICLSEKIKLVGQTPVWSDEVKGYGCFACINYCPEQAIQIKSKWYLRSSTDKNGRYHHPKVTLKDIAIQKY